MDGLGLSLTLRENTGQPIVETSGQRQSVTRPFSPATYIPEAAPCEVLPEKSMESYNIAVTAPSADHYEPDSGNHIQSEAKMLAIDVPGACLQDLGLPEDIYPSTQNVLIKTSKMVDVLEDGLEELSVALKKRLPPSDFDTKLKGLEQCVSLILEGAYRYSEWLEKKQKQSLDERERKQYWSKKKHCHKAIEELCLIKKICHNTHQAFTNTARNQTDKAETSEVLPSYMRSNSFDNIRLDSTRACFNHPGAFRESSTQESNYPVRVTVPVKALRCWDDTKTLINPMETGAVEISASTQVSWQELASITTSKLSKITASYSDSSAVWSRPKVVEEFNAIVCLLSSLTLFCNQLSGKALPETPLNLPSDVKKLLHLLKETQLISNLYQLLETTKDFRDNLGGAKHHRHAKRLANALKSFTSLQGIINTEPQSPPEDEPPVSETDTQPSGSGYNLRKRIRSSGQSAPPGEEPPVTETDTQPSGSGYNLRKRIRSSGQSAPPGEEPPITETDTQPSGSGYNLRKRVSSSGQSAPPVDTHLPKRKKQLPDKRDLCSIGSGLKVLPSRIPGASKGLFANRNFDKGDYITWYGGDVMEVSDSDRQGGNSWRHRISLDQHTVIQSPEKPARGEGGGAFINDGINIFSPPNVKMIAFPRLSTVYVQALQPLKKGDELLASYEERHWETLKSQCPDEYDRLVAPQIRSRETALELLDKRDPKGNMASVVTALGETALPSMPEWTGDKTKWTPDNVRYALFKAKVADGEILNLPVLRQLNPSSDEYFTAIAMYAVSLSATPRMTAFDWNGTKNREALPLPQNGVFKAGQRWSSSHFELFRRLFQSDSDTSLDKLKMCLKTLEPASTAYEDMLEHYIKMATGLKPGDTLDLKDPKQREIRRKLYKLLPGLPLPVNYKGKPFLAASENSDRQGRESASWTFQDVYRFLRTSGIDVQEYDRRDIGRTHQLKTSLTECTGQGEEDYFQQLKTWCQKEGFNFARIADLIKRTNTTAPAPFRLKSVEGLNLKHQQPSGHGIALQYLEHFGFDDHGLLLSLSSIAVYKALELFQQPVIPSLAPLYEQLFSYAWRSLSDERAAEVALQRHPTLSLPISVKDKTFNQAFRILKNKGIKLEKQMQHAAPMQSMETASG
ncbi:hypothetical protein [Endozoicomonas lisbonensis]|uniref:SET domain-containing protein n=1 Tax=Endozoicomonas lisbonensis TaxID=3120522 RepID=A0ABV2SHH0_9GAMM